MEPITDKEVGLIVQLREKLSDIKIDAEFFEDRSLVMWLRARNWKVSDAEIMIRKHIQWLKDENIDSILDWDYPPGWKEKFPWKISGFDYEGNPVMIEPLGKWDGKSVIEAGFKADLLRMSIHKFETLKALGRYLSRGKKQYVQCVAILDLEGISLTQINSRETFDALMKQLRCFEANYPESIKNVVILNASWIFKICWKIISPFVPERTYSKLLFLGTDRHEWKEALLKIIPEDQFPKYYGGSGDDNTEIRVSKDGSWNKYSSIAEED